MENMENDLEVTFSGAVTCLLLGSTTDTKLLSDGDHEATQAHSHDATDGMTLF